jgi:hypothetical protein
LATRDGGPGHFFDVKAESSTSNDQQYVANYVNLYAGKLQLWWFCPEGNHEQESALAERTN